MVMNDNIDFSIIDSELKAYLIGFFYADATLDDYTITIRLSINDIEYVEKLAKLLNKTTFIKDIKNKNGKIYKCSGFNICSKMSVDSLRSIGFIPNKTYQNDDIIFRNIPNDLKRHFIRGYLDGDGTIYFSDWTDKKNNWNNTPKCSVGFVSINKKILESINEFLSLNLNLSNQKKVRSDKYKDDTKNDKYWRLIYNGNRISKKILDYLYNDSTFYMDRKYNEYLKIVVYNPIGYHFHKSDNAWRVPYKDENNKQKWKNFKNEIDAQTFLNNLKNDEFVVEPIKGYYKDRNAWRVPYIDNDNKRKWKRFKNECDAKEFSKENKNKNKIETYEKFISKMVK
jgi:hypothetical protein